MTTEQAIAEIVASKPRCLLGMVRAESIVDVPAVARAALAEIGRAPLAWTRYGHFNSRRRMAKDLAVRVRTQCQPKCGCAFVLLATSGLAAFVFSAALYAVVESCVCWWMEHRVLPQD